MKQKLGQLLLIGSLVVAAGLTTLAQEKKPGPDDAKVQTDGTFKVLASKSALGKVVKGAPYAATALTERVQTLSDGNQIVRKNQTKLYRDSEGRTRTEQSLETIGKWTAEGESQQFITINDPVAGMSVSLDPHTRTAHKNVYALQKPATAEWLESVKANGRALTQAEVEALKEKMGTKPPAGEATPQLIPSKESKPWELQKGISGDPRRKVEMLGKQVIEGVEVVGTRSTYTIPTGEIGNTLPIEVVDETWYSPELQLMVLTKSRDPRSGETSYRLTNLTRSEPARALFEVPADYTLKDSAPLPLKKRAPEEQ
ncbi:MAG: hypothetical protein HYR56_34425 [Acidobacteria bacterium]|nr:hypothetical protein [Acidobacteriota bacterium]MBI3425397.1 hypothetical protein [Acidobacteriota bacterium]